MTAHDPAVAHHFADLEQQHDSALLGMWIFLVTEAMLFGGLFTAYALYRSQYPEAFAEGSHHLSITLGAINTVVLISSSLTMVLAHHAAHVGQRKPLMLFLLLTILLGGAFLVIKTVEYGHKFQEGLALPLTAEARQGLEEEAAQRLQRPTEPTDPSAPRAPDRLPDGHHIELFLGLYFVMTGLHAAHMIIGMSILLVLLVLSYLERLAAHSPSVEIAGLYWHFVDLVWIYLFPLLYLIGLH